MRSRAYRLFTRVPERWTRRAPAHLFGDGPVTVAAGPAKGLELAFPVTHIQAYGLVRGTLEPSVQEALRRHVAPGATVWDVGANIGFFSLLAARLGASDVHAVEPLPESAALIRRNAGLNGAPVTVHEVAAGARAASAELLVVGEHSQSHLADRGRHPDTTRAVTVEVAALDELGLPAPSLVKLDVEGSELDALQGMRRTLTEHRPVLVVELHATNTEFVALMDELGYRTENLDGPEPVLTAGPVHALAR